MIGALGSRALLHIENADAETSAEATAELARRLDGCAIIVSGRYQGLGAGTWMQIVIDTLDEEQSIELLQREAGLDIVLALEDKKRLARELGYLPLALHLAAGHLRAKVSVNLFLRRLRDRKKLLELKPHDLLLDKADKRGILSSTFALSLDLLEKACEENGEVWTKRFATLGHAPASGVGQSLGAAMAGLSEADFEDLMDRAARLSLATRGAAERMAWSVHPLLALLLRRSVGEDVQWMQRMTAWFRLRLQQLDNDQHDERLNRWKEIGQEEEALVSWLAQMPLSDAISVAQVADVYAWLYGPFSAWMTFLRRVLANTEDLNVQSAILLPLSGIARKSGLLNDALDAATQKVEIDQLRGDEHEIARAFGAVADAHHALGNLDEALRIRREEQLPRYDRFDDVRSRAITVGKIADIFQAHNNLDEALRLRRDEVLPVFDLLGDVRERAVTMGKIADSL